MPMMMLTLYLTLYADVGSCPSISNLLMDFLTIMLHYFLMVCFVLNLTQDADGECCCVIHHIFPALSSLYPFILVIYVNINTFLEQEFLKN